MVSVKNFFKKYLPIEKICAIRLGKRCAADTKEHMTANYNFIMSGKYELLRCLGTGANSIVYHARHLSLERECAIKIFPKHTSASLSFLTEAQVLRSLHHPGIPEIYDISEDEGHFYLVEEYIPGESLDLFLLHQNFISRFIFFDFCIQLCDIFAYLHAQKPCAILYQDLKPEHLIVCGKELKLIDFGNSISSNIKGNNSKYFGNLDFSAPESFSSNPLSIAADIYSIGKIMEFLFQYVTEPLPENISSIIRKATSSDPGLRYETVEALRSAIQNESKIFHQPHLLKNIAIIGSANGCGATHIAISLVSACNTIGYPCCYLQKNSFHFFKKTSAYLKHMAEKPDGSYVYRSFKGFPQYGPGISIVPPQDSIVITDYGTNSADPDIPGADLLLFICNDSPWRRQDAIEQAKILNKYANPLIYICNPGNYMACLFYARQFSSPIQSFFYDQDPFQVCGKKIAFARKILKQKGRSFPFLRKNMNFPSLP